MRSRRSRSWAVLIAGLLVVGLAAWLLRRENPGPEATSTPSPDAGRETGWAARWTIDGDTLDIEQCLAEAATTPVAACSSVTVSTTE